MINSNIIYSGKVFVDIEGKSRKTLKNNGTNVFFKLLYDILAQKLTDNPDRSVDGHSLIERLPTFMNIVAIESGSEEVAREAMMQGISTGTAVLLHDTPIQKRSTKTDANEITTGVVFEALVYHSNVYNNPADGTYQGYIVLKDGTSNRNILAFTEIELSDLQPVRANADSQARLTWVMNFGNNVVEGV